MRAKYSFGVGPHRTGRQGSSYTASVPGVIDIASGENLEVDPPRRLVQTLQRALERRRQGAKEPPGSPGRSSRSADSCRLTVVHDQLRRDGNGEIYGGWPMILSGLKTLLETGEHADHAGLAAVRRGPG